jgi:hypothetical protein
MKNKIKNPYIVYSPREGVTQYTYMNQGKRLAILSVGDGPNHYADADKDLVEIAILDKNGDFIPLTSYDDVAGYVPRATVDKLMSLLEDSASPKTLFHHYFEDRA